MESGGKSGNIILKIPMPTDCECALNEGCLFGQKGEKIKGDCYFSGMLL
jgi:hypothetical protein